MLEGCQTCTILPISSPDKYADALLRIKDRFVGSDIADKSREFYEENFTPEKFLSRIEGGCKIAWRHRLDLP
jgi:hypothetical protein